MKVIELKEFLLDRLTLTERPQPKLGAGEVLVRMHAASLTGIGAQDRSAPAAIRDKLTMRACVHGLRSTTPYSQEICHGY